MNTPNDIVHPNRELSALLPGPDRKRTPKVYFYRLNYPNPAADSVGCVMTWEVYGGRMPYQIAIERRENLHLKIHCTCADAIFRREEEGRLCKHVQGFLEETLRDVLQLEHREVRYHETAEEGPRQRSVA
jgi:hypothetical protein